MLTSLSKTSIFVLLKSKTVSLAKLKILSNRLRLRSQLTHVYIKQ